MIVDKSTSQQDQPRDPSRSPKDKETMKGTTIEEIAPKDPKDGPP